MVHRDHQVNLSRANSHRHNTPNRKEWGFSFVFNIYSYAFQNSVYVEIPVQNMQSVLEHKGKMSERLEDYIKDYYIDTPKRKYNFSFIPEDFFLL